MADRAYPLPGAMPHLAATIMASSSSICSSSTGNGEVALPGDDDVRLPVVLLHTLPSEGATGAQLMLAVALARWGCMLYSCPLAGNALRGVGGAASMTGARLRKADDQRCTGSN